MRKPTPTTKPRLSAFKAALAERGIPYSTGRLAVQEGELSVFKFGRVNSSRQHWYVDNAELDAWIEARRDCRRTA